MSIAVNKMNSEQKITIGFDPGSEEKTVFSVCINGRYHLCAGPKSINEAMEANRRNNEELARIKGHRDLIRHNDKIYKKLESMLGNII